MEPQLTLTADNASGLTPADMAFYYLMMHGYVIAARNIKYRSTKIDLVAIKDEVLVFVVVRVFLEESSPKPLTPAKQRSILATSQMYLLKHGMLVDQPEVRFDLVDVNIATYNTVTLTHKVSEFR